jgi:hypothetical protein
VALSLSLSLVLNVDVANAASGNNDNCGRMDKSLIVDEVKLSVEKERYFKRYKFDGVEISKNLLVYNDSSKIWSSEFYLIASGNKVERFFAMINCDLSIEYSRDSEFRSNNMPDKSGTQ